MPSLLFKKIGIFSSELHQLLMGAAFYDASIFKRKDAVCHSYSGKAVANENCGAAL